MPSQGAAEDCNKEKEERAISGGAGNDKTRQIHRNFLPKNRIRVVIKT
jgi:hypothetical protein